MINLQWAAVPAERTLCIHFRYWWLSSYPMSSVDYSPCAEQTMWSGRLKCDVKNHFLRFPVTYNWHKEHHYNQYISAHSNTHPVYVWRWGSGTQLQNPSLQLSISPSSWHHRYIASALLRNCDASKCNEVHHCKDRQKSPLDTEIGIFWYVCNKKYQLKPRE